jgi:acyl dehydratase
MEEKLGLVILEPVSRLEIIKYAGASGDFNPIHTIDEEAEKAGLPGVIAHGMLTMGKMGTLLSAYLDRGFVKDFSIRFTGMVFVGDVISVEAILSEQTSDGEYSYKIIAENQKGKQVAKGSLLFAQI